MHAGRRCRCYSVRLRCKIMGTLWSFRLPRSLERQLEYGGEVVILGRSQPSAEQQDEGACEAPRCGRLRWAEKTEASGAGGG